MQPGGCLKVPARKSFFMQINVFVNTTGIFGLSELSALKRYRVFQQLKQLFSANKSFLSTLQNLQMEKIADQFLEEESSEL